MTKKEMFKVAIDIISATSAEGKDEVIEGLTHEIELLSRPRKVSEKETAKQVENKNLQSKIYEILINSAEPMGVKAIADALGCSTQKVTAMLRQMDGVNREVVKGKAVFSV